MFAGEGEDEDDEEALVTFGAVKARIVGIRHYAGTIGTPLLRTPLLRRAGTVGTTAPCYPRLPCNIDGVYTSACWIRDVFSC